VRQGADALPLTNDQEARKIIDSSAHGKLEKLHFGPLARRFSTG